MAELLVRPLARAFALEAAYKRLRRVGVEEFPDFFVEVVEIFWSRKGDGENGVDEDELVGVGFIRRGDLDAEVEEADAVFELCARRDCLAADGGRGFVVGRRIVGAGDG